MQNKLSTFEMPENRIKVTYTPSYTHYPQKNRGFQERDFTKKQEQMFCEDVIKIG
mgnify:FL=1